jgi:hypothetical protein
MRVAVLLALLAACGSGKDAARATPGSDALGNAADPSPTATARSGDVELTAGSRGGVLELTFRNTGTAAIPQFATHIFGDDLPNYDWMELTLTDAAGQARAMRLVGSRDKSGIEAIALAPGAEHVIRIDLVEWANRQGAPLAPGTYRVLAVWDTTHHDTSYWHGRLELRVAVTIS